MRRVGLARSIVSITSDRSPGGIANSLITYSKAMATADLRHIIILPSGASILPDLKGLKNVELVEISRAALRFHLITGFSLAPALRHLFDTAALIFVHNARHIAPMQKWSQSVAINHTGKLRHLHHAARIMFLNHAAQRRFHAAHPSFSGKSFVIHHAFDLPERNAPERPSREKIDIISAGRLLEKKGFGTLIEAAALLQEEAVPCHIRIFGAGEDADRFRAQISELKLGNIELRSWVSDLHAELCSADLFCLPSRGESFPLVIGEAMQAGCPVVSTRTDGMIDYVERCEAPFSLVCDIDDARGLADQLKTLVLDDSLRRSYGHNALSMAHAHFSLARLGQDFEALISR